MVNATPKRPAVFLENAIFYLSLLLLSAIIGAFFYVRHLTNQYNEDLAVLAADEIKAKTGEQKNLEKRIMTAGQKLGDFSKIMTGRKSAVGFFDNLEGLVLRDIYFTKCNLDLSKSTASFFGHGKTFQDLGRQSAKFEATDILESADLGRAAIGDDRGIDFEIGIVAGPKMVVFK